MTPVHTPVLLAECLEELSPRGEPYEENAFMIDSTLGEGGHSEAFLKMYPGLKICGLDADKAIQARARERLSVFGDRMSFYNGWFNDFYSNYPQDLPRPNLILFDLGISIFHYELSGRGFSFRNDEPLDMRIDPSKGRSAADIVNDLNERDLADLIYLYGEEKLSRKIASAIVLARASARIESSAALAQIISDAVGSRYAREKIHPATRTFQALRIAVNDELGHLPKALFDAFNDLAVGGKMGVITFHSLEDRIVKNFFRNLGKECVCPPNAPKCVCGGRPCAELLTRKPLGPSDEEIKVNSPSRSAKLRVVRKIMDADKARLAGLEAALGK
ncbi:MAG: 16S rRNA (cytosine(1402)-N(4))-methyltransferase RsmH [Treponema sp.]|nr:16S rRNA (cytosine(1402)-N(4))-methyltransferase RsmH [Treponema sp.]